MILEIIIFAFAGILVGMLFGLIPGLHPNFLVLLSPVIFAFVASPQCLIVFVVCMAISNAISDFIPSILLGAPEEGTELSVTPGHKMLLRGFGYQAVKLAIIGGFFSVVLISLSFPLVFLIFPMIYNLLSPFLFLLLAAIVLYMVLSEKGGKKIISALCFIMAGVIGISLRNFPLDSSLSLFPALSGLFGASILIMQFRKRVVKISKSRKEDYVSRRLLSRSVLFGSLGGILAGFLPGVGTSQIASLSTIDKNEKSFMITLGSLATSNILISMLTLYLINKARSGMAVILGNYLSLTYNDVLLIIFAALFSAAVSSVVSLRFARIALNIIEKTNYAKISKIILIFIIFAVIVSSGLFGFFLFIVCTSLGIFAYLSEIKMSVLMGILILPTIIFYFPF